MSFTLGLRTKATLLASFFLILPWIGYQYILEMESFLRQGQEQTLMGTTRAVATALHERPKLFNRQASFLNKVEDGKDLYAYPLKNPIKLDGKLDDWQAYFTKSTLYGQSQTIYQKNKNSNNPISFRQLLGTKGKYLYGYLQVTDKHPIFRDKNSRFLNKNDHLIIAISDPANQLKRYIISPEKKGWFNGYLIEDNPATQGLGQESTPPQREKRLQGFWQTTKIGYNIEFRLPITLLGDKLGFSLYTSSNKKTGEIDNIIATSDTQNLQKLGTILVPSPEIDKILKGLSHSQSRLWVVDRHQRVLASAGDIRHANGVWTDNSDKNVSLSWWKKLQNQLLKPLYRLILSAPNNDFVDELKGSTKLNSEFIKMALSGQSQSSWRLTNDNKTMILSAASPIFVGDKVMGIVVAEETTNGIRSLRNKALEKLFNSLIVIIVIGTLLLFLFTANIASRITKLRDQTESAIDQQGRISAPFSPSTSGDEIGDLSRGLSDMVSRLGQYHLYLENLASRLSHELHTPVAVVRSSLENLALLPQNEENQKYIKRAQTGILRLNRILTNMSEATRLEQSLQRGEKEILPLNELLKGVFQGVQMTYPAQLFLLNNSKKTVNIYADPDFIMQCLDKLINNAMEFSPAKSPITLSLHIASGMAVICIKNKGSLLPENMSDELLNSMVSIRNNNAPDKTHLGLGLFIAKMICDFHHAKITINNNQENNGVDVTLSFPLLKTS
ncbi:proteobacterial dedicated sortase system histidine kinase [Psychromonas hadalis]|uniref:proteobacterial dedicated sortase system histidine kinase n=1 Tax=Psychromonas hadalis TaxID=211669 RepID=UPI0003B6EE08|nr:proteobacterial dedicated sortase system histidine kinase [Psychromonas hadalis]